MHYNVNSSENIRYKRLICKKYKLKIMQIRRTFYACNMVIPTTKKCIIYEDLKKFLFKKELNK